MSIQGNVYRAMRDLDERGVVVLQDPEINTTKIALWPTGWLINVNEYDDPDDVCVRVETQRANVEETIRSWFKCREQLELL